MALHVKNAEELHRYGLNKAGLKAVPITEKIVPKAKKEKHPWPVCQLCGVKTGEHNFPQYRQGGEVVLCTNCWNEEEL